MVWLGDNLIEETLVTPLPAPDLGHRCRNRGTASSDNAKDDPIRIGSLAEHVVQADAPEEEEHASSQEQSRRATDLVTRDIRYFRHQDLISSGFDITVIRSSVWQATSDPDVY